MPDRERSRREFFTMPARKAAGIALSAGGILASLGILADGFKIQNPEEIKEYLEGNSNIRIVFGQHMMGRESLDYQMAYINSGDLSMSCWNQQPLRMIDTRMREAKGKGVNTYLAAADGLSFDDDTKQGIARWPFLPHPDLDHEEEYPANCMLLMTETPNSFGINEDIIDAHNFKERDALESLQDDIELWYGPYTPKALQDSDNQNRDLIISTELDTLIAGALASAGLTKQFGMERRTFLKELCIGLGIVTIENFKLVAQDGFFTWLMQWAGNSEEQKLLAVMANVADQSLPDKDMNRWAVARTAWTIEKALTAQKILEEKYGVNNTIPTDLLFGSFHAQEAPRLMTDRTYRLQTIQEFTHDLLGKLDHAIKTKYPVLAKYRENILKIASGCLSKGSINDINYPWYYHKIPSSDIENFELGLLRRIELFSCESIDRIQQNMLEEFGVKV